MKIQAYHWEIYGNDLFVIFYDDAKSPFNKPTKMCTTRGERRLIST